MKLKKWLALALALTLTASRRLLRGPSGGDASPSPSGSASAESDLAYIQDKGHPRGRHHRLRPHGLPGRERRVDRLRRGHGPRRSRKSWA